MKNNDCDISLEYLCDPYIMCEAKKGSHIDACAMEAAELALRLEVFVKFCHNDKIYQVNPYAIARMVISTEKLK